MQLQPTSKAAGEADGAAPRKANPFGDAKPIDASAQVPTERGHARLAHGTPTPTTPTRHGTYYVQRARNECSHTFRVVELRLGGALFARRIDARRHSCAGLAEGPAACTAQAEAEKRAEEKLRKEQEEAEAQRKVLPNLVFLRLAAILSFVPPFF